MRNEYDFTNAVKNPYIDKHKDEFPVIREIIIPEWMSIKAERDGINLSKTLQEALRSKFN